jgi:hypothetical protein
MFRYFFSKFWPAFRHLTQATTTTLRSARPPQPALALPLFRPPGFQEPALAAPRPAVPRDISSFRIPSNPYSGTDPPSSLPASSPALSAAFAGSAA